MFSPHLFTHKYDIDEILTALCGTHPQWLDTENGTLSATEPATKPTHRFRIEPLPASYIQELTAIPEQTHLTETEQQILRNLLKTAKIQDLPNFFTEGRPGGWLRERIKETALEWLDAHDLIPPSMRHINRQKAAKLYASRTVKIEDLS